MAHFLKGKYKAFYQVGSSECVRDIIRFRQFKDTKLQFELTRRDMESKWGRYWRYENAQITLIPLDESQPQLGGKVKVQALIIDWCTFTPQLKTLYGVYSDDFITFGEFAKEHGDPLNNEELLIKVCDENDKTTVPERTTFRFEYNNLHFKHEVNGEVLDTEIHHEVPETKLSPLIAQSWSESLFYGVGNRRI